LAGKVVLAGMAGFVDFVAGMKRPRSRKTIRMESKVKARAAQTRRSSEVAKACRIETDAPQAIQVDLHESQQSTHPNKLGAAIAAFLQKSPPVCAATRAFDAASTMNPSEVGKNTAAPHLRQTLPKRSTLLQRQGSRPRVRARCQGEHLVCSPCDKWPPVAVLSMSRFVSLRGMTGWCALAWLGGAAVALADVTIHYS